MLADLVGAITHSSADASNQPPIAPYLQQGKTSDVDLFERLADEHPWLEPPPPDDSDDGGEGADEGVAGDDGVAALDSTDAGGAHE